MSEAHPGPRLDVPAEPIHRLTREQYRQMAEAGILGPDDCIELLEGWLVEKMTKKPPHRIATRQTHDALEAVVPPGWYVESQEPIVTTDSEPEPDVAVIRGRTQDYVDDNPPASEVGLVVEISHGTQTRDRVLKARIYARAGIAVYWILDLAARRLEVLTGPSGPADEPAYSSRRELASGESVPVSLDGVEVGRVNVSDLLP